MEEKKATIEQQAGSTVLQTPKKVKVGNKEYTVSPPSTATLILASEAISLLPNMENDKDHITEQVYRHARHCRPLGDVVAILILGARGLTEERKVTREYTRKYLFGLIRIKRQREEIIEVDRKAELSQELLETLTPSELNSLFASLSQSMQLGSFFGLTTFLTEINLLSPTKVENES